jgi:hypothetical protein
MTDLLEGVLRNALANKADQVDRAAIARLTAVDYRPRRGRLPVLPALGLGGLGAAAASIVAVMTIGSSASPAFAGWTAVPTHPRPGQLLAAYGLCGSNAVLTEKRGPFTAAVYARPDGAAATCLRGPSDSFDATNGGATPPLAIPRNEIQTIILTAADSAGHVLTLLDGRTGTDVARVRVDRSVGGPVTATVSHGWYLAWWPGRAHPTNVQITTAAGTRTAALAPAITASSPACGGCSSVGPSELTSK